MEVNQNQELGLRQTPIESVNKITSCQKISNSDRSCNILYLNRNMNYIHPLVTRHIYQVNILNLLYLLQMTE